MTFTEAVLIRSIPGSYLRLSKVMQSIFKVLNIIVHVHKPAKEGFSSRANDHLILT